MINAQPPTGYPNLFEYGNDEVTFTAKVDSKKELPANADDNDIALVADEVVYSFNAEEGEWKLNLWLTHVWEMEVKRDEANKSKWELAVMDAVTRLDFGKGERKDWTLQNWMAHVGAGLRSDHLVVFGSIQAVDAMIRGILNTVAAAHAEAKEAGPLTLNFSGGTELQRTLIGTTLIGKLAPLPVKVGENLSSLFQRMDHTGGLGEEEYLVVMEAVAKTGITIEADLSPKD